MRFFPSDWRLQAFMRAHFLDVNSITFKYSENILLVIRTINKTQSVKISSHQQSACYFFFVTKKNVWSFSVKIALGYKLSMYVRVWHKWQNTHQYLGVIIPPKQLHWYLKVSNSLRELYRSDKSHTILRSG